MRMPIFAAPGAARATPAGTVAAIAESMKWRRCIGLLPEAPDRTPSWDARLHCRITFRHYRRSIPPASLHGMVLVFSGERKEGRESLEKYLRLSPRDPARPIRLAQVAASYYLEQDYWRA